VAVTQNNISLSRCRLTAGGFAAAIFLCATTGMAQAQSRSPAYAQNAPGAAGLAPSSDAGPAQPAARPSSAPATLTPSQSPPLASQGPAPNAPAQGANQPSANQQGASQPGASPSGTNPPAAGQASAQPAAPPEEKRGFLNGIGQWWDESVANFNAKLKEQQAKLDEFNKQQSKAAEDATQAMKNAADAMFTPSKVIEIQERCPIAGNGAPDCATAATNVCKAKGFSDGRPVDTRIAQRCKASLWVSGQAPNAADCAVETVLLRVSCQP
jgi:hypothetical protein